MKTTVEKAKSIHVQWINVWKNYCQRNCLDRSEMATNRNSKIRCCGQQHKWSKCTSQFYVNEIMDRGVNSRHVNRPLKAMEFTRVPASFRALARGQLKQLLLSNPDQTAHRCTSLEGNFCSSESFFFVISLSHTPAQGKLKFTVRDYVYALAVTFGSK